MAAARGRPPGTHAQQPLVDAWQLDPAMALLGAILKQVLVDTRSPREDVKAEALTFLADPGNITFWGDLLDVRTMLEAHVQRLLSQRGEPC